MAKSAGHESMAANTSSSSSRETPVSMWGSTPSGTGGSAATISSSGADDRVSSSDACKRFWKSSRAASASSSVRWPRLTSDSVYSLRTDRCWSILVYINGWV